MKNESTRTFSSRTYAARFRTYKQKITDRWRWLDVVRMLRRDLFFLLTYLSDNILVGATMRCPRTSTCAPHSARICVCMTPKWTSLRGLFISLSLSLYFCVGALCVRCVCVPEAGHSELTTREIGNYIRMNIKNAPCTFCRMIDACAYMRATAKCEKNHFVEKFLAFSFRVLILFFHFFFFA